MKEDTSRLRSKEGSWAAEFGGVMPSSVCAPHEMSECLSQMVLEPHSLASQATPTGLCY